MKRRKLFIGALSVLFSYARIGIFFCLFFLEINICPLMENSTGMKPIHLPHCTSLPAWRRGRRERLQMWGYRLLFCVTLITPWPNLFPQRSLGKAFRGGAAWKSAAQQMQSCCDRRSGCEVSCGEPSLCETLATRCDDAETFQPSGCCFLQPVSL